MANEADAARHDKEAVQVASVDNLVHLRVRERGAAAHEIQEQSRNATVSSLRREPRIMISDIPIHVEHEVGALLQCLLLDGKRKVEIRVRGEVLRCVTVAPSLSTPYDRLSNRTL